MSLLNNIWANENFILKLIILIAVVVGVIALFVIYENLRPLILALFSMAMLFFGITTAIENIAYMQANNLTIGEVFDSTFALMNNAKETEPGVFNITGFGFKQVEGDIYQATFTEQAITSLDFQNEKYVLYINDYKCYVTNQSDNYLTSEFQYAFYDDNFNEIIIDKLTISIAINANETNIVIQTSGGQNAVELWKAFQVKNNFVMSFKTATAEDFNVGGLVDENMD